MKLSKGESRQKSPVTEQYKKILKQYKAAIKRADAAGYKTQAIIPVVVPDQSKRSSTAKLKAAYKSFKAKVQRERNVKLAEQRIATRNYNNFKKAAAKATAKAKEEKVKTPKPEPTPKTPTAQERQREETTTPKQQPNANPVQKQRTKPVPDYDYMAFNNLQNVVNKALFVTHEREAKSDKQQAYFENVEKRAADIIDILDELHFYSPEAAGIYGDRIDMLYKQIQSVMEAYAWYDSQGMIDTSDDLDQLKQILRRMLTNQPGMDAENIAIQKKLNDTFGDTGSGEPATY